MRRGSAMIRIRRKPDRGFTLLELTIAMAVLVVILGATAQGLISFYVAMDMQNQRQAALRHCTSVLSDMRVEREAIGLNGAREFPDDLVALWPAGAQIAGAGSLPRETVVATYTNATANPLEVTVTSSWRGLQGRPLSVRISTLLTDR